MRRSRWIGVAVAAVLAVFAVGAFLAYGTASESGTPRQKMVSWVQATDLGSSLGTVEGDAARVTTVVDQRRGTGVIHTVCGVLVADAASATAELPTPDTKLTDELARGYELAYKAGNDCYNAGAGNRSLLQRSARERRQALGILHEALGLVDRITGATVPTTTTTQPPTGGIFG